MTKLFALGGLGAAGAGVVAAVLVARRAAAKKRQQQIDDAFDYGDIDSPVIVEEVVIVTEADPFDSAQR